MKRSIMAGLLASLAFAAPSSAATLFVAHGIDGTDLGLGSPELAVDICLVNSPLSLSYPYELFSDVEFRTIAQVPLDLPAGRYDVEVRLASAGTCRGAVAIAASFSLGLGENATAIAHLTEYGTPTLTKFVNDVRPLADGETRVYARHAAAFGDVDVFLRKGYRRSLIRGLENADQEGAPLKAGTWYVAILPSGTSQPALEARLPFESKFANFVYAVGSPANGTFTVLTQAIDLN